MAFDSKSAAALSAVISYTLPEELARLRRENRRLQAEIRRLQQDNRRHREGPVRPEDTRPLTDEELRVTPPFAMFDHWRLHRAAEERDPLHELDAVVCEPNMAEFAGARGTVSVKHADGTYNVLLDAPVDGIRHIGSNRTVPHGFWRHQLRRA